MKVLIVDDDRWFADSVAAVITNTVKQSSIKIAFDAETAMDLVDTWQPDLLLLDMNLGTKNGLTLLNELQSYADTRNLPIIALSVDTRRLNLDDLRSLGVRAILDKTDITPRAILDVIREVSRGR